MSLLGHYVDSDDALCIECLVPHGDATPDAIFSDTEADTPTHCTRCETLIAHNLTPDGLAYVAEHIQDHVTAKFEARQDGRACILRQWWEAYGDLLFADDGQLFHDQLLQLMLTDYFLSVPTVDEHSPKLAVELATIHGMFPHRWCVVNFTQGKVIGPFVSLLAAGTITSLAADRGQSLGSLPFYGPMEGGMLT